MANSDNPQLRNDQPWVDALRTSLMSRWSRWDAATKIGALALAAALCGAISWIADGLAIIDRFTGDARPSVGGPTRSAVPTTAGQASSGQPKTVEAVRVAAREVFTRFAAGDFVGTWDLYSSRGKGAISRDDYARINGTCTRVAAYVIAEPESVRMVGQDRAVVEVARIYSTESYTFVYEEGGWKLEPAEKALQLYKLGADSAIAEKRTNGTCNN